MGLATGRTSWGDPDAKSDDDVVIAAASFRADGSVPAFQSFGDLLQPPNPGPSWSTDLYALTLP